MKVSRNPENISFSVCSSKCFSDFPGKVPFGVCASRKISMWLVLTSYGMFLIVCHSGYCTQNEFCYRSVFLSLSSFQKNISSQIVALLGEKMNYFGI